MPAAQPEIASKAPASPVQPATKTCRKCGRERAIGEFTRLVRGGQQRRGTCRFCFNENRQRVYRLKRLKDVKSRLRVMSKEEDAAKLAGMCTALITSVGDMANLSSLVRELMATTKVGSPARRFLVVSVLNLAVKHEQLCVEASAIEEEARNRQFDETLQNADDGELDAILEDYVRKLIRSNPQVAIKPLERAGWTVSREATNA